MCEDACTTSKTDHASVRIFGWIFKVLEGLCHFYIFRSFISFISEWLDVIVVALLLRQHQYENVFLCFCGGNNVFVNHIFNATISTFWALVFISATAWYYMTRLICLLIIFLIIICTYIHTYIHTHIHTYIHK